MLSVGGHAAQICKLEGSAAFILRFEVERKHHSVTVDPGLPSVLIILTLKSFGTKWSKYDDDYEVSRCPNMALPSVHNQIRKYKIYNISNIKIQQTI